MNMQSLKALIILNLVLLAAVALLNLTPQRASAQQFVRSQYIMVAGDLVGRQEQQVVYIIEITTGRVAAVLFNGSNKTLDIIDGRSLINDLSAGARK